MIFDKNVCSRLSFDVERAEMSLQDTFSRFECGNAFYMQFQVPLGSMKEMDFQVSWSTWNQTIQHTLMDAFRCI